MDKRSLHMYQMALQRGKEKCYDIRVMVVGPPKGGKTTLTRSLFGKKFRIPKRKSIGHIHIDCCNISMETKEWITGKQNAEHYSRLQRLLQFLNMHVLEQDTKGKQESQSEMDGIGTIEQEKIINDVKSSESEKPKDAFMETLQLVNTDANKLEKSSVEYARLSVWDFAGDNALHTSHQTFLSSHVIYLLVIDFSQPISDIISDHENCFDMESIKRSKVHELVEVWMNSIHTCAPSHQDGTPPVILVGTHLDKIPEEEQEKVKNYYFNSIRYMLKDKPSICHLVDCIVIGISKCDHRLESLKMRIFEVASKQRYWGEETPACWIPLEQSIMTLKASGVKIVPHSVMEEINSTSSVKIEDVKELDLFLRFQHERGRILYFSVQQLRKPIILDPKWMIDAQKSLITCEAVIQKIPALTKHYYEFTESGKLAPELLDAIWTKQESAEFFDNKEDLLLIMEELGIIVRPRICSSDQKEVQMENWFLVPCMLRERKVDVISTKPHPAVNSPVLCYVYVNKFLPSQIFHRLLAACLTRWPIFKKNSKKLVFCDLCVFKLDMHHRMTVFFREYAIFVRVTGMGVGMDQYSRCCIEVRNIITQDLSMITTSLKQNLQFELYIQCPKYNGNTVDFLFPVAIFLENENVPCYCDAEHIIMSSEVLKVWFEHQEIQGKVGGNTFIGKLHQKVLNRCLPELVMNLDFENVIAYIQQKELFDPVTTSEIMEQRTTSGKMMSLIQQIQKGNQYMYEEFKECLVQSGQKYLKDILERTETNITRQHVHGTDSTILEPGTRSSNMLASTTNTQVPKFHKASSVAAQTTDASTIAAPKATSVCLLM